MSRSTWRPGQVVTGVELVITRKLSHAEGTVVDDRKQPVLDATVVFFPLNENARDPSRASSARPGPIRKGGSA